MSLFTISIVLTLQLLMGGAAWLVYHALSAPFYFGWAHLGLAAVIPLVAALLGYCAAHPPARAE